MKSKGWGYAFFVLWVGAAGVLVGECGEAGPRQERGRGETGE